MPIARRALAALTLLAAPARAASPPPDAAPLLARLPASLRGAHAAILFPRTDDPFTVARQHAEGWCAAGNGRFGLSAPPLSLPPGPLAVVFGTEAAMRPLLQAGAWEAGPHAGPVLAVALGDAPAALPLPPGLRLFRLRPPPGTGQPAPAA